MLFVIASEKMKYRRRFVRAQRRKESGWLGISSFVQVLRVCFQSCQIIHVRTKKRYIRGEYFDYLDSAWILPCFKIKNFQLTTSKISRSPKLTVLFQKNGKKNSKLSILYVKIHVCVEFWHKTHKTVLWIVCFPQEILSFWNN